MTKIFWMMVLGFNVYSAWANGAAYDAMITRLFVDNDLLSGKLLTIDVDVAKVGAPPCATDPNWDFTLDLSTTYAQEWYSLLLTAYTTGRKVTLEGDANCEDYPDIEKLEKIIFTN